MAGITPLRPRPMKTPEMFTRTQNLTENNKELPNISCITISVSSTLLICCHGRASLCPGSSHCLHISQILEAGFEISGFQGLVIQAASPIPISKMPNTRPFNVEHTFILKAWTWPCVVSPYW